MLKILEWVLEKELELTKNNLYDMIPIVYKQWSFHIEIMPTAATSSLDNIVQMGLGGDDGVCGDRMPAIFFDSSLKLIIQMPVNDDKNQSCKMGIIRVYRVKF